MEIELVEKKKNRIVFLLKGTSTTLANALRDELWNDKSVTVATFGVDHPLTGSPKVFVETDGKTEPLAAITNASKRLQKRTKELAAELEKL